MMSDKHKKRSSYCSQRGREVLLEWLKFIMIEPLGGVMDGFTEFICTCRKWIHLHHFIVIVTLLTSPFYNSALLPLKKCYTLLQNIPIKNSTIIKIEQRSTN